MKKEEQEKKSCHRKRERERGRCWREIRKRGRGGGSHGCCWWVLRAGPQCQCCGVLKQSLSEGALEIEKGRKRGWGLRRRGVVVGMGCGVVFVSETALGCRRGGTYVAR